MAGFREGLPGSLSKHIAPTLNEKPFGHHEGRVCPLFVCEKSFDSQLSRDSNTHSQQGEAVSMDVNGTRLVRNP